MMPPKRGIKRQRSDGLSELASTVSTKASDPKPMFLVPNSSGPAFAVFNDPIETSQPRRNKKARLDPLKLSTKDTNATSIGEISPIRLVPVPTPSTSTAPSLKDRLAFGALTIAAAESIPSLNVNSQPAQSMAVSPPTRHGTGQGLDVTAFLTSPDQSLTPKKAPKIPPFFLKSPFRPAFKPANSKSMAKPTLLAITRRPSESTALRRPLAAKDIHRRPSDSYGYGRRPRPSSFMKNLPPPASKGKLTRDPSLLDSLLKSVPRTPPNRNTLKSPSVLSSSEARMIPPIPHVMMQLDTPGRDAEKLVADMSQFSLDPKCDEMISSPVQKAVLPSNNNATALTADENEMHYEPLSMQSSPGIEVPSQDDSWCRPAISQSSPIKSILPESSDPLDMFHPIRFPPVAKRFVANSRGKDKRGADSVSGSSIEERLGGKQGFKRSNKVYGKRARKSVHFSREGRSTSDEMDLSEDEILLK